MIRYLYANELHKFPKRSQSMFEDRADQFKVRLGWDVSVDDKGRERDEYDDLNPLYVIWEQPDGSHGGSMRFLPTTGPVMVNDLFAHLIGGGAICSPLIWECTRFFLSANVVPRVAAALMMAGGEIMTGLGVCHFVSVFDARMVRIYRMIGSSPEVLGAIGEGRETISVCLWEFTETAKSRIAARAELSEGISRLRFNRAFGRRNERRFEQYEPLPIALSA
jgi:N-acyl-L-homoserine lactone synthetase